jgi:hypothetical protein
VARPGRTGASHQRPIGHERDLQPNLRTILPNDATSESLVKAQARPPPHQLWRTVVDKFVEYDAAQVMYAAFFPVNMKPRCACLFRGFLVPADGEMSIRLFERAVFNRIGCQLVHSHRKRLDCAGGQPNAFRSLERDPSTISPISRLRGKLGLDEFVEGDLVPSLLTKQKALYTG